MKTIDFAEKLPLPVDAATQTIGFVARKRAGKSYAAGKLAEGFAENGVQFVVFDPVGNWWGLRVAANGKSKGLDVVILGGLRGDIALDANAGSLVADTVLDSGRSFVLDVSQFSLGERKRFATAFGERLWLRQKSLSDPAPIHVFLEEAQLFLPQQPMPDDRHMVGIWTEIVRLGGNKGVGVTLITQRPQSVTKEALTQVECLVVLQVSGVPEKKALREWIVEKEASTDLLDELPFLKPGVAYIWSPQWLEHFGQHKIHPKRTFDGGMTPKVGVPRVQAEVKPIDLEALRVQMAEVVTKLEANDPRMLRKRIVELEKQLAAAPSKQPAPTAKVEIKTVPILREKELALLDKHLKLATKIIDRLNQSAQVLATESNNLAEKIRRQTTHQQWLQEKQPQPVRPVAPAPVAVVPQPGSPKTGFWVGPPRKKAEPSEADGARKLGRGARDMLRALASSPGPLTKSQAATLARVPPRKSTFRNSMSELRVGGFVEERGEHLIITDKGRAQVGDSVEYVPPTTADLVAMWTRRFPSKVNEMLKIVVEAHPNSISYEELGARVGIDTSLSTWRNYLSMLRSNALVETDASSVRASETLFP